MKTTFAPELEMFDESLINYNKAIKSKPNYEKPYNNIGNLLDKDSTVKSFTIKNSGKSEDIEIKSADSQLTIKSVESDDKDEKETLHRGISKRKFSRTFTLADDIKVNGAELKDGMLLIDLEKIVPEEKKPRTIDIK